MVERFERDFARFCDSKFASEWQRTDALRFALLASGNPIGENPPLNHGSSNLIATDRAISHGIACPYFVIRPRAIHGSHKLLRYADLQCVLDAGTVRLVHRVSRKPGTAVSLPVHLSAGPLNMDPILEIACAISTSQSSKTLPRQWRLNIFQRRMALKKAVRWDDRRFHFLITQARTSEPVAQAGAVTTDDEYVFAENPHLRAQGNCAVLSRMEDTTVDLAAFAGGHSPCNVAPPFE